MLKLTRKLEYGLLALDYIASHTGDGPVNVREIAERYDIPQELLAKILQKLGHEGFIEAHHGVHGGYRLLRELKDLTLVDLVSAIEGPIKLVDCEVTAPEDCPQYSKCTIKDPIVRVQRNLQAFLSQITLAELISHDLPLIEIGGVRGS